MAIKKMHLNQWIESRDNKLFDEEHLLNRFVETGKTDDQYNSYAALIRSGRASSTGGNGKDIKTALKHYYAAASQLGFSEAMVTDSGDGTYNIVFTRPDGSVDESACPSLTLSDTDEYGITTSNHLPSVNALTWIRHANGQVGLTSAAAVGIDNAADQLLKLSKSEHFRASDAAAQAKRMRRTTSSAVRAVTSKNPMATSRNQKKAFEESFSMDTVNDIRPELAKLMGGQSITSYYYSSLLNAVRERQYAAHQEALDENKMYKQLGEIEQHAKNFTSAEDLGKYIQKKFPVVYKNLWKGELENLYNGLYSVGITHGPKTEGATGVFSLFNPQVPGQSLSALSSRKPAQNLRILQKGYQKGVTKGFAPNMTSLKGQFQDKHFTTTNSLQQARKNLYVTGELTDQNIQEATFELMDELIKTATNATGDQIEDRRNLLGGKLVNKNGEAIDGKFFTDALKGLMSDGTMYAHQILDDFKITYNEFKTLHRPELEEKIQALAQLKLTDDEYAVFSKLAPEERLKALQSGQLDGKDIHGKGKNKLNTNKLLNNAVSSVLGLNKDNTINGITYNADEEQYVADIGTRLRKGNFTVRGGATTDDRSVAAVMNDQILGRAFEKAGYSAQDIWNDPSDHTKGLKMTHARLAQGFSTKTAASDFMGMYQYIYGSLHNQGKTSAEITKLFDNSMFKGLITPDTHGGVYWNERQLQSLMQQYGVSGLIRGMAEFGASKEVGVYHPNAEGKLFENTSDGLLKLAKGVKLPTAEELGASSVYRYEGINDEGSARMRFGPYEIQSIENTAKKMRAMGHEKAATAMDNMVSDLNRRLAPQQEQFKPYLRNAEFLRGAQGNNFQRDKNAAIEAFKANNGLVLTLSDFEGVEDVGDYSRQVPGALMGSSYQLYGGIIEHKREEYYNRLIAERAAKIKANLEQDPSLKKLPTDKELEKRAIESLQRDGIGSARDVQGGLDFGSARYLGPKGSIGGFAKFGPGSILTSDENGKKIRKVDADGNEVTMLDEIAQQNARIVRAAKRLSVSQGDKYSARQAGDDITDATSEILATMTHGGSVWDRYNTVRDDNGGYALLQSMSSQAKDTFAKLGENFTTTVGGNTVTNTPTSIMNTDDYISMLSDGLKKLRSEANKTKDDSKLNEELSQLQALYQDLYGTAPAAKISDKKLIESIANGLDIDNIGSGGFKHATDSRVGLWRSPTLKFVDDIVQGGMVLSRNLVSRGNLMVDPSLASAIKADFDGDRIAIFKAALGGDYETVQKLVPQYYQHLREAQNPAIQKDIDDAADQQLNKSESTKDPLNSLQNKVLQQTKEAGVQAGKKFAGIYGDLNYGLSRGLSHYGLDYKSIISTQPDTTGLAPELTGQLAEQLYPAIGGEIIQALPGALYQEGINIKNIDVSKLDKMNMSIMEAQDKLSEMMLTGSTWNDPDKMTAALGFAQDLGILKSDEDGLFKANVLGNINLSDTTKLPESYKKYFELMMQNAITRLSAQNGKETNVKNLQTQLENLQNNKQFTLTSDLFAQILTDKDKGINAFLARKGTSVGEIIQGRYGFMPGREFSAKDVLGLTGITEESRAYDEETLKKAKEYGLISDEEVQKAIINVGGAGDLNTWSQAKGVTGFLSRYKILSQEGDLGALKGLNVHFDNQGNLVSVDEKTGDLKPSLSTTGLIRRVVGGYMGWDPENNDLTKAITSIDNLIANPDSVIDKKLWSGGNGSMDVDKIRPVLNGSLIGNLAHRAAEVAANLYQNNASITKEEVDGVLNNDTEYQHALARLAKSYELEYGGDTASITAKTKAGINRAGGQVSLLLQQLQEQGARIVGAETGMIGTVGHDNGVNQNKSLDVMSGIADLIYATGSTDTNDHTIHLVDYKNYTSGKPSADVVGQLSIYADMIRMLQEDLARITKEDGAAISSREYLERNTGISQLWSKLLNDQVKEHGRDEREQQWGREYEEQVAAGNTADDKDAFIAKRRQAYIDASYSKFDKLFAEVLDPEASIKLHTNITSPGGIITSYNMRYGAKDAPLVNRFLGGQGYASLSEAEQEQIYNRLNRGESMVFDEDTVEGKKLATAGAAYRDLNKYFNGIQQLRGRISAANENGDTETAANLQKELDTEIEDFQNATGKGPASKKRRKFASAWGALGDDEARADFMALAGLGVYDKKAYNQDSKTYLDDLFRRMEGVSVNRYWDSKANASTGNKWLKNEAEIRKYENMLTEAKGARDTVTDQDSDRYKELTQTIENLTQVLLGLESKATDLEQAWYKRDKNGDVMLDAEGNPIYKEGFKAWQSKNEVNSRIAKEERHQELADEYKTQQLTAAELIGKREILLRQLDDSRFTFSDTERAQIKVEITQLNKQINQMVLERIGAIEEALKEANGGVLSAEDEKMLTTWKTLGVEELAKVTRNLPSQLNISANQQQLTEQQTAYDLYRNLNTQDYNLWKNEEAINKATDPATRELLELERENLILLREIAADKVKQYEGNIEAEQNPAKKEHMQDVSTGAKHRADLEYDIQKDNYKKGQPQSRGLIGGFEDKVGGALKYMVSGYGIYRLIGKLTQAISKLVSESKALDKTLTNLRIVTGNTKDSTRNLISEYANLASSLGVTTQEVSNSAVEWLRQGYSVAESMDLVKSSMYLSTLGMIDSTSATKSLTSALKGFKLQASESMDVVDKLTALDLKAATSAGDIAEGLSQFANLGSLAGVSIDEAASYVATISDVTQMSGSSAGQALDFWGL